MTMKIQGDMILHAVDYLHRKRGSEGVDAISGELGFNLNAIHEEAWYPLDWYVDALDQITKTLSKKGFSVASRIGYDRSKNVGFLKVEKDKLEPLWVLKKVQTNWPRFYSSGRVEIIECGPSALGFEIHEYASHPLFCERTNGFVKGLLREVCGFKDAIVEEEKCTNNGNSFCQFNIKW